jgi:SPP1 gp7 family putative phage head morphogenesis protein
VASIIDRLFPRPEAKAVTGPGAFALGNYPSLRNLSRDPNRLMHEAQVLFHSNAWVNAAERAIGGRFTRMAWHLEDENGDTVDETSAPNYQAVLNLLERPSQNKTRRQLWGLTIRHNGLCGNAAWLLDQRDGLAGTPLELLYINPARLTPIHDENMNILGWVLDAPGNPVSGQQGRPGVPLEKEEVLHFTLDEPDWGVWGIGVAEAAQRKIELDRMTDGHIGGVLGSGGRLAGLIAPKQGVTVNDDQWKQFVNDYRRITDDPDAAKRLQVAKMPLDFTQMTASPKDLQLNDVSKGNRDDILAAWAVPPSQIGIMAARGLNSGETVKYEEAALWQGAIEPRAEAFREKVQTELLDRFADLGVRVKLVFEYPSFDDQAPLFENATKSKILPLTNDERRALVGLDPLEDEAVGKLIYIASEMKELGEKPQPSVPFGGPRILPDVPTTTDDEVDAVKAKTSLLTLRAETEATWTPKMQAVVQRILDQQKAEVAKKSSHLLAKPKDTSWWSESRENKRFMDALEPLIDDLARDIAVKAPRKHQQPGKASTEVVGSALNRILNFVRARVGARITGINQTTREKVQAAVAEGIEKGLSPAELGDLIEGSAAFDEYRAEMIARTETAYAYNDSAIQSYRELDVEKVEVIDGDADDVCAPVNGATWTMDEALAHPVGHPNCTRDFIPVLAKASLEPVKAEGPAIHLHLPESMTHRVEMQAPNVTVNVPDFPAIPTPVVNYTPPVINVPETVVNYTPPAIHIPEAKATLPQEVRVVSLPDRVHRVVRKGKEVTGSIETDGD